MHLKLQKLAQIHSEKYIVNIKPKKTTNYFPKKTNGKNRLFSTSKSAIKKFGYSHRAEILLAFVLKDYLPDTTLKPPWIYWQVAILAKKQSKRAKNDNFRHKWSTKKKSAHSIFLKFCM